MELESYPEGKEKAEEFRRELLSKLPKKIKDTLAGFGVESPTDRVPVTLETAAVLFDLYCKGATRPESPLGKRLVAKKEQELAEALNKEEFEIPEWARQPIHNALSNDAIWTKTDMTAYTVVDDQRRFFVINYKGASYFTGVINAIVEEFDK
jgi:hypothetical protein